MHETERRIEEGDEVMLVWNIQGVEETIPGRVLRTPQGAGDSWQIVTVEGVRLVNAYALHFEGMIRHDEEAI